MDEVCEWVWIVTVYMCKLCNLFQSENVAFVLHVYRLWFICFCSSCFHLFLSPSLPVPISFAFPYHHLPQVFRSIPWHSIHKFKCIQYLTPFLFIAVSPTALMNANYGFIPFILVYDVEYAAIRSKFIDSESKFRFIL